MDTTKEFRAQIKAYLDKYALTDEVFAAKYISPKKSLISCVQYILNEVKRLKVSGMSDDEVFGLAKHYYDEKQIDIGEKISSSMLIVTNRASELTEEDKANIKKEAMATAVKEETERIKAPKKNVSKKKVTNDESQSALF